jgi:16S rRNA processing protein RimM
VQKRWIQLGIVGKAHGLNGAFFISQRDELLPPQVRQVYVGPQPESARKLTITKCRLQGGRPLLLCLEINQREAAEALLLQPIWCERRDLVLDEAREYMWGDLIGKEVRDSTDVPIGVIAQVGNFGASDIVCIRNEQGLILEVPFVKAYFDMEFKSGDPHLKLIVTADVFAETWSSP